LLVVEGETELVAAAAARAATEQQQDFLLP